MASLSNGCTGERDTLKLGGSGRGGGRSSRRYTLRSSPFSHPTHIAHPFPSPRSGVRPKLQPRRSDGGFREDKENKRNNNNKEKLKEGGWVEANGKENKEKWGVWEGEGGRQRQRYGNPGKPRMYNC